MKLRINERESSPAELAWNEFKNLISVSIPKRIEIIENKLQQNGQTIFASEVIQEFNNIRTRLDNLQQQYQLTESMQRKGKVRLSESKLRDIIRESVNKVLKEGVLDDYDEAEQRLRAAREKGDTKEIIAAAKEWHRLKDIAKPEIEARKMNNQKESERKYVEENLKKASDLIHCFDGSRDMFNLGLDSQGFYRWTSKKDSEYEEGLKSFRNKVEEAMDCLSHLTRINYDIYNGDLIGIFDNDTKKVIIYQIRRLRDYIREFHTHYKDIFKGMEWQIN